MPGGTSPSVPRFRRAGTAAVEDLCRAVDEWIHIHHEDREPLPEPTAGREYSGKFVLRVGRALHKDLAIRALRAGVSLNSYCVRKLRARPGRRRA